MQLTKLVVSIATAASIGIVMFIGSMINDQLVWQSELSAFSVAHASDHQEETQAYKSIQENQEGFKARVDNIERLILRQAMRDISADIRWLEQKRDDPQTEWTDADQRLLDRANEELADTQRELDASDDD